MANISDMTFSYDYRSFENFKKISIILLKFNEFGHIINNVYRKVFDETIEFNSFDRWNTYDYKIILNTQHGDSCIITTKISLESNHREYINHGFWIDYNIQLIDIDSIMKVATKENIHLLSHLEHYRGSCLSTINIHGFCKYDINKKSLVNMQGFSNNIKFCETNFDLLKILTGIFMFNIDPANIQVIPNITVAINSFGSLKTIDIPKLFETPSITTINTMIKSINDIEQYDVSNIKCGAITITRDKMNIFNQNERFTIIRLCGIPIVREYSFDRFETTFHPGFHLACRYLELSNRLNDVQTQAQKACFKKI